MKQRKSGLLLAILAAMLVGLGVRATIAADPQFVGILATAAERDVATQVGLSDDDYDALLDWIDEREGEATDIVLSLKDKPDELKAKMAEFAAESETLGLKRLTAEQQQKLRQLHVAREGLATLGDAKLRCAKTFAGTNRPNRQAARESGRSDEPWR